MGTEDDCLRANELVNVSFTVNEMHSIINPLLTCFLQTGIDTPLTVHAYHASLVAHQQNSIYCLNLLKELAEKSPAFCRLISKALLQINQVKDNPCCVLDKVFLVDSKLWIGQLDVVENKNTHANYPSSPLLTLQLPESHGTG